MNAAGNLDWLKIAIYACGFGSVAFAAWGFRQVNEAWGRSIDEAFGDVVEIPPEAKGAAASKKLGGVRSPGTHRRPGTQEPFRTHGSGGNTP